ncbi:ABC transporter ATP-binding protein [Halalkalibacterium halodurans]|jgi:ABC-type lipoprotein export system ATPase subunit|nr:ABC transporter ATP-binding protein [Halalkalibacterium halodurans]MED4082497.1 ABC transporter ATP-binding protein [Halalkalibacterium halodurans]MED4086103.1 ABC transporter ATP-binding protein [Halalkalibacterium halodurans]MED4106988.1 ABC transporter ATP-binding protein [Halalkalibacterium halodurans]MED4108574.1 ABC transporter ATP-binding protein [Halalkalibacterium halodurans]MED4124540.1 ABC transporter ATP-binding protein [Halalkalibacterium halodurans]
MMIQLKNVSVTYQALHETLTILQDITLTVASGEWLSIVGPSGSGKTTLLKLIAGALQPVSGTVTINERSITDLAHTDRQAFIRTQVASVYQQFRLLPQFNVLENVMLPLVPYESRKTIRPRATELIDQVGLSHRMTHYPHQLSGGEQQRVSFARALLTEPAILLCDEPTGNLDQANRDNILDLLSQLHAQGQTIVLATHDDVVARRGDRTISIDNGTIHKGELGHASL